MDYASFFTRVKINMVHNKIQNAVEIIMVNFTVMNTCAAKKLILICNTDNIATITPQVLKKQCTRRMQFLKMKATRSSHTSTPARML